MLRRFVLCAGIAAIAGLGMTTASASAGFGFLPGSHGFEVSLTNQDGTPAVQAGSHPYKMTVDFNMNLTTRNGSEFVPEGDAREIEVGLPAGVVVNPTATPTRCTEIELLHEEEEVGANVGKGCPVSSQVGTALIKIGQFPLPNPVDVYNMVPPAGEPAELGFTVLETVVVHILPDIRTGSDTGISSVTSGVEQVELAGFAITLWGDPSDPSHDEERHYCNLGSNHGKGLSCPVERSREPLLTLPTSCSGPLKSTISADSWQEPEVFVNDGFEGPGMTGCGRLGLQPSFTAAPDTARADTPAGLTFSLKTPQEGLLKLGAIAASDLKTTKVTLPAGVAVNPGQAAGLVACQPSEDAVGTTRAPSCPAASKVGTVEITTPLLDSKFYGNVYILPSNPPDLQLLVAASSEGVNLKLVGHVHLDPVTGQLTTTFANTPQLPFTELNLSFSGGAQAALATPTKCGVYTTTGDFTPWSSPEAPDSLSESSFAITSGTAGAPCPGSVLPFSPSLIAGSTTDQAGGFTDFSLLLQAPDDQQRIKSLQFKVPQGLLGMISQVPLCGEQQAADGTCSSASQIGHTVVASGPGPYPLVVPQPGQPPAAIYLTGPYKGAPYGLSIVVPVVVGPFTLETQIVRAKIEVDPLTAQITVTTDPFPQIIDGVPTDLRTINAVIDRPGFMFNPTNCSPLSFAGTAYSAQGANVPIGSHFQMGSCRSLLFKPDFKVSTSGKTSRKNGASLDAKIVYPMGPLGANQASSQSNLRSVKVDLPKQLPSRLTTLQKACTSQVFEANPANCPADSRVGSASAVTPVLPVTLTGPAYFVSYGGAKFPELVFALQGYGVTIYVHGETFINKAGITSSTFHQVPDVPIYQFELNLPQGPFSALAANGDLCNTKLKMPTAFTAQDGAQIKQSTPITVTGCAKKEPNKSKGKSGKRQTANTHGKKR